MYTSMSPKENYDNWGKLELFFLCPSGRGMDKAEVLDNFKRNFNAKEAFGNEFEWGEENSLDLRLTSLPDVHFLSNVVFRFDAESEPPDVAGAFLHRFCHPYYRRYQFYQFQHGADSYAHQEHQHAEGAGQFRPYVAWKFVGRGGLRQSVCLSAFASFLIHNPQNTGSLAGGCRHLVRGAADDHCRHGRDRGDRGSAGRPLSFLLCHLFPAGIGVERKFLASSLAGRRMRSVLVGVQFVASFILIIGSLFMYLQNHYMQNAPLGYDKEEMIIVHLNNTINKNRDAFTDRLKSFSGVQDVTYSQFLLSSQDQYMGWGRDYNGNNINFQCLPVSSSFLKVMGDRGQGWP